MSTDQTIGQMIEAKDMKHPRVTPADIQANIVGEYYFTAAQAMEHADEYHEKGSPLHLLTFCVLVLKNGFTVTGESACASPENFDAEIGRAVARRNAIDKIWPLMGYALKQKLHDDAKASEDHY